MSSGTSAPRKPSPLLRARRAKSTSSTRSPAANGRATSADLGIDDGELDGADLRAEPAERAHVARRGCTAHAALPQLVALALGLGGEPLVAPFEEPEQERRLRAR